MICRRYTTLGLAIGMLTTVLAVVPLPVAAVDESATAVAAGGWHTCVLKTNRNVDCYGDNEVGQAADYTFGDATAVATGSSHTCVLKTNGNVDCYGWNGHGEAADYTFGDATAVATGWGHTCVLKTNGNVDCYGDNPWGQAADYALGDATAVATGYEHTCVLKTNGNVDCYGRNNDGQAADYTIGDAIAVEVGYFHTCVLKTNGNVDCYGYNGSGQATDYTRADATAVGAGNYHTCVLKTNGNVDCYGRNMEGQAADYTLGDATAVLAGGYHTCVLKTIGNVDCYGHNDDVYGNYAGQAADYVLPECRDGWDNDGDGRIDYSGDSGCSSASDADEHDAAIACDDGLDNDGDGRTDYPDDPGCSSLQENSEETNCPELAPGIVFCLVTGATFAEYAVGDNDPSGPSHHIAGYVDLYRFTLPGGLVRTLPCVHLQVDAIQVNPCATAGRTFDSRMMVLMDRAEQEPAPLSAGAPLTTARICYAELSATVSGVGVKSASTFGVC